MDGEGIEQRWADVNDAATSTKEMCDDGVKMYTSTPNANSSVARRGSERVVGEGEGLSTT